MVVTNETAYRWRAGSHRVAADVAAAELERIRMKHGVLTPQLVVEYGRAPGSPLRPEFDSPKRASQKWWLQQARSLCRDLVCIPVTYTDDGKAEPSGEPEMVYLHLTNDDGPRYEPTQTVANDPDLLAAAEAEALTSLRGWSRRYEHIQGLATLREVITTEVEKREAALGKRAPKRKSRSPGRSRARELV